MRTIKFRGKATLKKGDKAKKVWVYGTYSFYKQGNHIEHRISSREYDEVASMCDAIYGWRGKDIYRLRSYQVTSGSIGQFTGLLDMYDKEIYEGMSGYIRDKGYSLRTKIRFQNGMFLAITGDIVQPLKEVNKILEIKDN